MRSIVLRRAAYLAAPHIPPDAHLMLPPKVAHEFCRRVDLISKLSLIWEVRAREVVPNFYFSHGRAYLQGGLAQCAIVRVLPAEAELMSYSQRTARRGVRHMGLWLLGLGKTQLQTLMARPWSWSFSGAYRQTTKGAVL